MCVCIQYNSYTAECYSALENNLIYDNIDNLGGYNSKWGNQGTEGQTLRDMIYVSLFYSVAVINTLKAP